MILRLNVLLYSPDSTHQLPRNCSFTPATALPLQELVVVTVVLLLKRQEAVTSAITLLLPVSTTLLPSEEDVLLISPL
jgi:hypothetical protein